MEMQIINGCFVGTAAQFIAAGAKMQGQPLDNVALSIMGKHGIFKIEGKEPKIEGKRGKPGNIYSIESTKIEF